MRTFRRNYKRLIWPAATRVLAVGALAFATLFTARYIHQPIVEGNAFRQTQTAISAFWMMQGGPLMPYITPVGGYPWALPFEFPIYQMLVAAVASGLGLELEVVGRLVSFVFLVACGWPAFAISRRLQLPTSVPWVFGALLWTSPLHVFWGRTFMIETTALFFAFACIAYAIDIIRGIGGWRSVAIFLVFSCAGILQKATTCGPVLLVLSTICVGSNVARSGLHLSTWRRLVYPLVIFAVPLVVGLLWTRYTDIVKDANPFGQHVTSRGLAEWNFGTLSQRLSPGTWRLLVWQRSLLQNAGGLLGLITLLLPWVGPKQYRCLGWLALCSITLFLLPMLIFTNLHFVHNYYQTGCVLFLIAGIAIVIGGWVPLATGSQSLLVLITAGFMYLNFKAFNLEYRGVASRPLIQQEPLSARAFTVGRFLREHTPVNSGLVIFGADWSSEIAYQAQRKAMTAPAFFSEYRRVWLNPSAYLGGLELGAIVVCFPHGRIVPAQNFSAFPGPSDVAELLASRPGWRNVSIDGCEILLPGESQP